MLCSLSNLDENSVNSIKNLENEIGKTLLSFSCREIKPSALDNAVLAKIQKLEKELSVALVAVDN